ncbi:MAG: flagellar assembly protein FliX [Roseococcus sp.]|nr:flagellar assembly protein FliX [Roseococcus sp.]
MVEAVRGYGLAGRAVARARSGAGGFRLPPAESSPAEAAGAVASIAAGALLGAGSLPSAAERDAAAQRRGAALLDALRELQRGLLADGAARATLGRIAALAEGESGADPALRELLAQIALRARVELLRRGGEGGR